MTVKRFYSHKELAEAYKVNRHTLAAELKRAGIIKKKWAKLYSPIEVKKIFSKLGNPFED